MLVAEGVRLKAIYFCPHGPHDGCDCRKPAPGMVTKAMRDFEFRPEDVGVVGDSDMGAAAAAGVKGVRVAPGGRSASIGAAPDFLEAASRARLAYLSSRVLVRLAPPHPCCMGLRCV